MDWPSSHCPVHADAPHRTVVREAGDRFFGLGGSFSYSECEACGAWALSPRPPPTEIGAYYAGYYTEPLLDELRIAQKKGRVLGPGRLRARAFLRGVKRAGGRLEPGMKILDVGSGLGAFLRFVRDFGGLKPHGVDFSPRCVAFAKEAHDLDIDRGELAEQKYPEASFDAITAWHYLEHVYDPAADLKEMFRILRPGGWLMIETPTNDLLSQIFGRRWFYLLPPTHLYHYRPATLEALIRGAGFEVKRTVRPWFPGELAASVLLGLGLDGFVPKLYGVGRPTKHRALTAFFYLQMLYDVPITLSLALLKHSGIVRVYAQKPMD
ncbi:MAG: class I SAM-dependent methyltransferase [Myxococcota bacterium]